MVVRSAQGRVFQITFYFSSPLSTCHRREARYLSGDNSCARLRKMPRGVSEPLERPWTACLLLTPGPDCFSLWLLPWCLCSVSCFFEPVKSCGVTWDWNSPVFLNHPPIYHEAELSWGFISWIIPHGCSALPTHNGALISKPSAGSC